MLYDNGLGLPPADFGAALRIAEVLVPRWDPHIIVADNVRPSAALEILGYRGPSKFIAPEITFSDPQPLLVRGGSFAVVAERTGVVPGSTYLLGDYAWQDIFAATERIALPVGRDMLVAANCASASYYHWIFQCLAPILVSRAHGLSEDCGLLLPPLGTVQRESLELAGIAAGRIVELPDNATAVTDRGSYTNLTSGDFAFVPHPALVAALGALGNAVPASRFAGKRVFISRADASNRRMLNEAELSTVLGAGGFETVLCGTMPLVEQIALFRDAALIVAQHGAALANLVFARDGAHGPSVVELHQDNYIHQAFLKLCQVKCLRYAGIVSPMVDPGLDGRHDSTWAADIPTILKLLSEL